MTQGELEEELRLCRRLLVLAYDDDCGLMAWNGAERTLLRAFNAEGADEHYWIGHLEGTIEANDHLELIRRESET